MGEKGDGVTIDNETCERGVRDFDVLVFICKCRQVVCVGVYCRVRRDWRSCDGHDLTRYLLLVAYSCRYRYR